MNNLKARLKEEEITLSNENNDVAILKFRNESNNTWANGFSIEFNCKIIHSSKTFKSFENRLNILIEKWNLEEYIDFDGMMIPLKEFNDFSSYPCDEPIYL